ncbi:related to versicolorin b synthase [Melanopsichium pennsylvanicum]|uniref:Related to versicolorin b synthase n=2 Tax=Melanopsichium pennsylvanicum TaxID=63383 RepID=A0AAJ4XLH5_9BASI|nr:related to versicolorin b synthase [Melanopsichium pennsylvanicum 4]SNX84999.1 related to versicolorin b synthase [Melanopsichium pennsylvanicum]
MTLSMARLAIVAGIVASLGSVSPHPVQKNVHRRLLFPSPVPTVDTYDYIVVGGGTSGMTLAARLSENKGVTVAVLEAGIDYRSSLINQQLVDTPGYDVFGVGSSSSDWANGRIDWNFVTEGEPGYDNRKVKYARGKCIGGSSARNFMLYHRPPKQAQQTWVQLTGDDQWPFDNTLPYYQKTFTAFGPRHELRKDNPPAEYNAAAFPGSGPVSVGFPNYAQPFSGLLLNSLNEVGVPTTNDMSSGNILGAQYSTLTIEKTNGKRASSRSFYEQTKNEKRTNINVIFEALAKKVNFDTTGTRPKAVSVDYTLPLGVKKTLKARKEIILSAGAFQSPQLLMVSGIGPADQLKAQNITILVENSNVGQHMQDHVFFGPTYTVKVDTTTKEANDPIFLASSIAQFNLNNQGIFTNNVADLIGFEKWNSTYLDQIQAGALKSNPSDWPEIEYLSGPGYIGDFSNLAVNNIINGLSLQQFATLLVAIVAPVSEGSVTLKSADTSDLPAIRPNWLSSTVDQQVAIAAFKRARQVFNANAMKGTRSSNTESFPGLDVATDDQILASIRKNLMTVWHAASSSRMAKSAKDGVLDSNFKVFGVDALRVVDASAFPRLLPGHPQAVCYMIAERAADIIAAANK